MWVLEICFACSSTMVDTKLFMCYHTGADLGTQVSCFPSQDVTPQLESQTGYFSHSLSDRIIIYAIRSVAASRTPLQQRGLRCPASGCP